MSSTLINIQRAPRAVARETEGKGREGERGREREREKKYRGCARLGTPGLDTRAIPHIRSQRAILVGARAWSAFKG